MAEFGSQTNRRPPGSIWPHESSDPPWSWFWASLDPCLGSVLSWSWAPSTVSVPNLPTEVGTVQSCQASRVRFQVLSQGLLWNSGKAEDRALQAGAGQEVLVASLAQRTGIAFPSSGSKLFFRKLSPKCKGCREARPRSLDRSSPIRGEGMCKRGSFTVHGGWDPQLLTSRLWPFKYVSGLGEERLPGPQHLQEAPSPLPISSLRVGGLSLRDWSLGLGIRHLRWLEA